MPCGDQGSFPWVDVRLRRWEADVSSVTRRLFCPPLRGIFPSPLMYPHRYGLYDPRFEHDACGVGFVARLSGTPSHDIVLKAVEAVANLSHRGAVAADGKSGDGSGVLTQVPRLFLAREAQQLGVRLSVDDRFGVAMLFFPHSPLEERHALAQQIV